MTVSVITRLVYSRAAFFVGGALIAAVGIWWGSCRSKSPQPVTTPPIAYYEPFEVVPESVSWPGGKPVLVETVEPPTKKDRDAIESDFHLNPDDVAILGRFELPELPHGGKGVVTVPKRGNEDPALPVKFTVKRNPPPPPPLFSVQWEPKLEGWYGQAVEPGWSGRSWSAYIAADDLLCVKEKICLNGRAGRESRPWGEGWTAEVGVSWRF